MSNDYQRHFVVTNKSKGLSLYNSVSGPTNISKSERIARARDKEYYGEFYGKKEDTHHLHPNFWNKNGFQVMCETRPSDGNYRSVKPVKSSGVGHRQAAVRSKTDSNNYGENFQPKATVFKNNRSKSGGHRQNEIVRTNQSFFDSVENIASGSNSKPPEVELRRSTREKKVKKDLILLFRNLIIGYEIFLFRQINQRRRLFDILLRKVAFLKDDVTKNQIFSNVRPQQSPKKICLRWDMVTNRILVLLELIRILVSNQIFFLISLEVLKMNLFPILDL